MAFTNLVIFHLFSFFVVESWHQSFPECASSDESPINIETDTAIVNSTQCDATFDWEIDYDHTMFKVINNGHSLQIVALGYTASTNLDEYSRLSSNYDTIASFPNYFRPPGDSEHRIYCLDSLHFHWGSNASFGSQHTINNQHFPLEAHFIHYACDQLNIKEAVNTYSNSPDPDNYVLAVVSILFKVSKQNNPAFDAILNESVLHKIANITGYDIIDNLDLRDLIPSNVYNDGYYGYQGPLTTPPCIDNVRWYLMKSTGSISMEQLSKFRILRNDNGEPINRNYRDIESNVNKVCDCKDETMQTTYFTKNTQLTSTSIIMISLVSSVAVGGIFIICLRKYNKYRLSKINETKSGLIIKQYTSTPHSYVLMYQENQK